jgi:hypothetical protein
MELRVLTNEARTETTLELWMNGEPLGHINLATPELEQVIHQLAGHRAMHADEVPRDLDPGARLNAVVDPVWRVAGHRTPQGRLLALRHPGLGWLSFVIPDHEAWAIACWLTREIPIDPNG